MPPELSPSERLILMFLKLYENTQHRGATREEILKGTGMGVRTFARSWKTLNRKNMLLSTRTYELTDSGRKTAEKLVG